MIQIEHLSVAYQQTLALEDLSLSPSRANHPRNSWAQRGWEINPDQGHAGTSPHSGKVQLDQKISAKFFQRVAYVEQKSAIDFPLPHHGAGVCLTGSLSPSFYLQAKKQRGPSKSGKCLETCQSS